MPSHISFQGNLIDIDEALRELDRWDCEESLAHFLKTFWKNIDPAEFKDGWVIDAICEHLQAVLPDVPVAPYSEPPLLLPFSVFFAIRDAVSSVGGHRADPPLRAPATSESILRAITAVQDAAA